MFRGFLLASITVLIWGVTFVNTKALLNHFSALEIQVLRFFMAYVALWIIHPRMHRLAKGEEKLFAALGLTGVAIYQLLENCAIHYTNASNVSILVSICPAVTALLVRAFNRESKLAPYFFLGFAVAITGVTMVSLNGIREFHFRPIGDLMAAAAMLSWGCYSILIGKANAKGYPATFVIRRTFFWALVITLPVVILGTTPSGGRMLSGSFHIELSRAANTVRFSSFLNYVNLGFLGLMASALCFVFWNKACKALGVVRCSVLLYLIPVITALFAFCFLGESLTLISATGALLTLLGVFLSSVRSVQGSKF